MDSWYYAVNGQQVGPVSAVVLRQMIAGGQLAPTDYVWREGMPDWQPAEGVPELALAAAHGDAPGQPYAEPIGYAQVAYDQPDQRLLAYQQPYQPPAYSDATSHYLTKFRGDEQAGTASTAFTLSIIGLFCAGAILGPIALVMGISALRSMSRSGTTKGQGKAIAAIVIGGLESIGTLVIIGFLATS